MSKFKVGDLVYIEYEMDGCCHDCEGTSHYLEVKQPFLIESIEEDINWHDYYYTEDIGDGFREDHLRLATPL